LFEEIFSGEQMNLISIVESLDNSLSKSEWIIAREKGVLKILIRNEFLCLVSIVSKHLTHLLIP
jgi:hypothetical protein